jgi:AcrR family transcriptional regulator
MRKPKLAYHRENLEDELLEKAAMIIATRGVQALSLRELGENANVSRSAAYHYFPNKDSLLHRVGEVGFARLQQRILGAADLLTDPVERLRVGFHAYVEFAIEDKHFFQMMFANVLNRNRAVVLKDGAKAHAFSSKPAEDAFMTMLSAVTAFIGSNQGDKRNPLLLTNVLWSYVHGVAVLSLDQNLKAQNAAAVLDAGLDLLLVKPVGLRKLQSRE